MEKIELEENPLELINQVTELNDLHEFMKDAELDRALHLVLRLILRAGDVPVHRTPKLIVELQAMSAKFAILAVTYTTILKGPAGTENNKKKNIYYTMSSALDRVVDALKYSARYGMDKTT